MVSIAMSSCERIKTPQQREEQAEMHNATATVVFATALAEEITKVRLTQDALPTPEPTNTLTPSQTVKAEPIAGEKIGVVLMHGKGGTPSSQLSSLDSALRGAGVIVENNLMPWGRGRIYDKTYQDSMIEIDEYVNKLKAQGAKKIVVAGHSLGANAALGYGATRDGLSGIIAIATGHFPETSGFQAKLNGSAVKAKAMVDAGNGEKTGSFKDINIGSQANANVSANIYHSWFSQTGPADVLSNTKKIKKGTPVLWIDSKNDIIPKRFGQSYAFDHAPSNSQNKYVSLSASHFQAPTASIEAVVAWLRQKK